jgi:two-component system response regulator AdeR
MALELADLYNKKYLNHIFKQMDHLQERNQEEVLDAINDKDLKLDLILLDIHMPNMDGIEVLKVLSNNTHPPIAMLTACATTEERKIAYDLGAKAYIVKPFNRKLLEDELEILFAL